MAQDRDRTLLEEWERLESARNAGRRQRAETLSRLGRELGAVRDALAEALESHRKAEEEESLAELDCGQMLRDALLASQAEIEAARSDRASLEAEHARALESLRTEHERALQALQHRLDKACSNTDDAIRSREVEAARLVELQTELDSARRHIDWHKGELEAANAGHEQERNLIRGRLAEEREQHIARSLEAKTLLDQARMRALAAEDDNAQLRRKHAAEVQDLQSRLEAVEAQLNSLRESARQQKDELEAKRGALAELESLREKLSYADQRMQEMSLALDLVRTSHEVPPLEDMSGGDARRVAAPMTRSSAPPRKSVKRRTLPPRPDLSPGGYSMTEVEIREDVVTDPSASSRRRRKT